MKVCQRALQVEQQCTRHTDTLTPPRLTVWVVHLGVVGALFGVTTVHMNVSERGACARRCTAQVRVVSWDGHLDCFAANGLPAPALAALEDLLWPLPLRWRPDLDLDLDFDLDFDFDFDLAAVEERFCEVLSASLSWSCAAISAAAACHKEHRRVVISPHTHMLQQSASGVHSMHTTPIASLLVCVTCISCISIGCRRGGATSCGNGSNCFRHVCGCMLP